MNDNYSELWYNISDSDSDSVSEFDNKQKKPCEIIEATLNNNSSLNFIKAKNNTENDKNLLVGQYDHNTNKDMSENSNDKTIKKNSNLENDNENILIRNKTEPCQLVNKFKVSNSSNNNYKYKNKPSIKNYNESYYTNHTNNSYYNNFSNNYSNVSIKKDNKNCKNTNFLSSFHFQNPQNNNFINGSKLVIKLNNHDNTNKPSENTCKINTVNKFENSRLCNNKSSSKLVSNTDNNSNNPVLKSLVEQKNEINNGEYQSKHVNDNIGKFDILELKKIATDIKKNEKLKKIIALTDRKYNQNVPKINNDECAYFNSNNLKSKVNSTINNSNLMINKQKENEKSSMINNTKNVLNADKNSINKLLKNDLKCLSLLKNTKITGNIERSNSNTNINNLERVQITNVSF